MYKDYYHYSVGNKKTLDKLEAIIWASEKNEWIHFHIPEWLQNVPTHIEPEQSFETLCIERAKRLRLDFNYIRLWFSGGIDSTYMLDTFVDNNILIDEIMIMKSGVPNADWEIDKVALPYIEKIQSKIKSTKITVNTPTINDYKDWYKNEYWFENYKKIGHLSKRFMGLRLNEKLESINLYKEHSKTANILGFDKPFINYVNGEWFTFFLDANINYQIESKDNKYIGFYNDDPLIFVKQCHMLKRGIETFVRNKNDYNKVCDYDPKYQNVWNSSIDRTKNNSIFIIKDLSAVDSQYQGLNYKESLGHKWMHQNYPALYKNYLKGIQNLNHIQNGKWFNKNNAQLGPIGIFADFKSLDRRSTKTVDELFPNGYKV